MVIRIPLGICSRNIGSKRCLTGRLQALLLALLAVNALFIVDVVGAETFRAVVLDVGEGQAVLLQQGEYGMLVDTGHFGKAKYVLDRMKAHGVTSLDYLVLTHLHDDHAAGYYRIREAFPMTLLLDNGQHIPDNFTPDTIRWLHETIAKDPYRQVVTAGDVVKWHNAKIIFLWPHEIDGLDLNKNSLVVVVKYGYLNILIMGDVGKKVEGILVKEQALPEQTGLLVAGHHGSACTGSLEFLKMVRPMISVISINENNIRGYPDPNVVEQLRSYSNILLKTFRDGEICVQWKIEDKTPLLCPPD